MKINLNNYDLFIFDWDGTLNSLGILLNANEKIKRALKSIGILKNKRPARSADIKNNFIDIRSISFMKKEQFRNRIFSFAIDIFFMVSRPKLHRDSAAILRNLKQKNKKIALFTNGGDYRIKKELRHFGLDMYFDLVISARKLGALKPDPAGLKMICSRMKIKKQRALLVGDSLDDMISGKNAGIDLCAITDGFDSAAKLGEATPRYIFKSIEEFYKNM
ncbi:MAG: HAD family hydrolase [Candidatus Marsarchaeota archaeon]|nr:HAD family hydrolase [Candidatus Marsarchaeota archaeon]MCL5106196.1 HAD family hydrolase [Candidatus Marsarchaeota archaeon]